MIIEYYNCVVVTVLFWVWQWQFQNNLEITQEKVFVLGHSLR